MRIFACCAKRELVHLQLAKQDSAGIAESLRYCGVIVRNEVAHDFGADGRANAFRVVQVLQANGYAVQRTEIAAALYC